MTRSRRSADRSRRLVSVLAIALALAWSATAHLLWQVESATDPHSSPAIRLVVSPLEPNAQPHRSAHDPKTPGKTSREAPRSATQPVLPDGETPAPCQVRRSLSTDVEVLASLRVPGFEAIPEAPLSAGTGVDAAARHDAGALPRPAFRTITPGRLSRPPPVLA